MNYKNATDAQINEAVTMAVGKFKDSDYSSVSGNYHKGHVLNCDYSVGVVHDYCNNPSYAWPIMMKNKITVIDFFNEYIAVHDIQFNDNEHSDSVADWVLEARHKNPLRAAMIVYLMMNEDKK